MEGGYGHDVAEEFGLVVEEAEEALLVGSRGGWSGLRAWAGVVEGWRGCSGTGSATDAASGMTWMVYGRRIYD